MPSSNPESSTVADLLPDTKPPQGPLHGAFDPAPARSRPGPPRPDPSRPRPVARPISLAGKRLLDAVAALAGLLILSPVLAAVGAAVFLTMGRPVLFTQIRTGYRSRPFLLFKFRTMELRSGTDGTPLPDDQRLTPLGRLLRRTSLDELPQLWNVLIGDMSLVGPRPLLPEYLTLYSPEQARRHEVRPGLTGWAQIRGRNAVRWEERLANDVWYVDHWSPALDLRILALTLPRVIDGKGVSGATLGRFQGTSGEPA